LIERACALNPNSAIAWNRAGLVKAYLGESAAAIENLERAMRLSPVDPLLYLSQVAMGFAHFCAGRYDDAVAWLERSSNERPDYPVSLRIKAAALAQSGHLDEARQVMAKLLRVAPQTRLSAHARSALTVIRRREDATRFVEGMRLAGMPE
jgi:tetratricopeptide (TPR) repeat protein